jgi:hypothetical protein
MGISVVAATAHVWFDVARRRLYAGQLAPRSCCGAFRWRVEPWFSAGSVEEDSSVPVRATDRKAPLPLGTVTVNGAKSPHHGTVNLSNPRAIFAVPPP